MKNAIRRPEYKTNFQGWLLSYQTTILAFLMFAILVCGLIAAAIEAGK